MAKDPAFLFYSSDFLVGTTFMTNEQVGAYIRLMCLQHQKGRLREKDMLQICKTYDEEVFSHFKKDDDGLYYNEKLEQEVTRRREYSESRKSNRLKKNRSYEEDMNNICESHDKHMETETETITEITNNKEIGVRGEEKTKPQKHQYGEYKNVLLSDNELDKLKEEFPADWEQRIEKVSEYCASKGTTYKNYLATIRNWAKKDKPSKPSFPPGGYSNQRQYDIKELERQLLGRGRDEG